MIGLLQTSLSGQENFSHQLGYARGNHCVNGDGMIMIGSIDPPKSAQGVEGDLLPHGEGLLKWS